MQSVSTKFREDVEKKSYRLSHLIKVAQDLTDYDDSIVFAEVGTSTVDGTDIIKGNYDTPTEWDYYNYEDITKRVISYEFIKETDYPLNKVAKSRASIVLDNSDGYLNNLRSGRFWKILSGVNGKVIPQFVGMNEHPKLDITDKTCLINAFDILQYLDNYEMTGNILTDVTGDEAIESILNEIGFIDGQYVLEESVNTIPFLWIRPKDKALEVIRKICEAENGLFYIDEDGIMRFENRYHFHKEPHKTIQYTFNYDNVIHFETEPEEVINKVFIKAYPREVQSSQIVWQKTDTEKIGSGGSLVLWASITDDYGDLPCTNVYEPDDSGTDGSIFTAKVAGTETDASGDISVTEFSVLGGSIVKIELTNGNAKEVELTELILYGTPAKVIKVIEYESEDSLAQDSIDEFGKKEYTIENDFIQSGDLARNLANSIIYNFKDPMNSLRLKVKGVPQLQIGDYVAVNLKDFESLNMYVASIQKDPRNLDLEILVRERVVQNYAIVDETLVDSEDYIVAP